MGPMALMVPVGAVESAAWIFIATSHIPMQALSPSFSEEGREDLMAPTNKEHTVGWNEPQCAYLWLYNRSMRWGPLPSPLDERCLLVFGECQKGQLRKIRESGFSFRIRVRSLVPRVKSIHCILGLALPLHSLLSPSWSPRTRIIIPFMSSFLCSSLQKYTWPRLVHTISSFSLSLWLITKRKPLFSRCGSLSNS